MKHRGCRGRSIGAGENALMGGDTRRFRGGGGVTPFHGATGPAPQPDLAAVLSPPPPAPKCAVWMCSLPERRSASKVTVLTMEPEQWDRRVPGHVPPTVYGPRTTIELRFCASELLQEQSTRPWPGPCGQLTNIVVGLVCEGRDGTVHLSTLRVNDS